MDEKDITIIYEVSVKAACELYRGTGDIRNAVAAAETFASWVLDSVEKEKPLAVAMPAYVPPVPEVQQVPSFQPSPVPQCAKCGGAMWDNRQGKRNPKAPDFKCKNQSCGAGVWLEPYRP